MYKYKAAVIPREGNKSEYLAVIGSACSCGWGRTKWSVHLPLQLNASGLDSIQSAYTQTSLRLYSSAKKFVFHNSSTTSVPTMPRSFLIKKSSKLVNNSIITANTSPINGCTDDEEENSLSKSNDTKNVIDLSYAKDRTSNRDKTEPTAFARIYGSV
ncbi:unnamed protein product [Medioppia subpectinata]|uniref:Uncharacterized protein n=1 Tax=Medioppia subpectinata TaxID=1979941 RepID=A0A7R9KD70_9ACAR|nr:unnamed protein product [Medioppia subpectinata]CAG2101274.1 unnamed protein product [Medioppia subpectinata]